MMSLLSCSWLSCAPFSPGCSLGISCCTQVDSSSCSDLQQTYLLTPYSSFVLDLRLQYCSYMEVEASPKNSLACARVGNAELAWDPKQHLRLPASTALRLRAFTTMCWSGALADLSKERIRDKEAGTNQGVCGVAWLMDWLALDRSARRQTLYYSHLAVDQPYSQLCHFSRVHSPPPPSEQG